MARFFLLAPCLALALAACAAAHDGSADDNRCQRLRALYTGRMIRPDITTQPGRLEAEIGMDLCRRGRYAEGAGELARAVRELNLNLDPR